MADDKTPSQDDGQSEAKDATVATPQEPAAPPAEPPQEPVEEPAAGETPETPQKPEEPQEPQEPVQEPAPTGHSKDRRMERLSEKLRQSNEQANYYRKQLFENPDYKPLDYQQGEEYQTDQLESDRKQYGQTQFQAGMTAAQQQAQNERFIDRLENDGDKVASKHSLLDEESESYDPDLTQSINDLYLATVGAQFDRQGNLTEIRNPNVRYKDYVDAYMASAEKIAASRNADTAKNVAQQASRTGVRPGAEARRGLGEYQPGSIANMSDEDFEKNRGAIQADINRKLGL